MKPFNVLLINHGYYHDALVQTATLPYAKIILTKVLPAGSKIILLTHERKKIKKEDRIEIKKKLARQNIDWITSRYHPFGMMAIMDWIRLTIRLFFVIHIQAVKVIQAQGATIGGIGYFLSMLTGKPLVVDDFEFHAHSMQENGTWSKTSWAFRILLYLEKKQLQQSFAVLTPVDSQAVVTRIKNVYDLEVSKKILTRPSCVDLSLFSKKNVKNDELLYQLNLENKIVCVYAGKFGGIYFTHETFRFFNYAHAYWKDKFRVLLLTSHTPEEINDYCHKVSLNPSIIQTLYVPHHRVPDYMGLGDFAVTPVKPVPSKRYCSPIKDGEYWALGLPVIIPANIGEDSDIIATHDVGAIMDWHDEKSYLKAIEKIDNLLKMPKEARFKKIRDIAEQYRGMSIAYRTFHNVYQRLIQQRGS